MTEQLLFFYDWLRDNPVVAILMVITLGLMFRQQPRQTVKFLVTACILVGLGYILEGLTDFTLYGSVLKERMVMPSR
jgi:hypothetical protein